MLLLTGSRGKGGARRHADLPGRRREQVVGTARIVVACDVGNPLTGPAGAAATYGPQKGATPRDVEQLALLDVDRYLRGADLVVVGEGSLDGQSLRGKAGGSRTRRTPDHFRSREGVGRLDTAGGPGSGACLEFAVRRSKRAIDDQRAVLATAS